MDAIIASLEQEGGEAAQKEEIEQMITPPEKAQLEKVKKTVNRYVCKSMSVGVY